MKAMTKKSHIIADGYHICEKHEKINIDTAYERLTGKWQRRYTSAIHRDGADEVELAQHVLVCPHCGCALPAYRHFVGSNPYWWYRAHKTISESEIAEWTSRQLSLFESKRELVFNEVYKPEVFTCKKCGYTSKPAKVQKHVWIEHEDKKIRLSCELNDMRQFFSIPFVIKDRSISFSLPMIETVVFNLRKGRAYIELSEPNGLVFAKKDITFDLQSWKKRDTYRLLNNSCLLQKIVEEFKEYWPGGVFPFGIEEVTPEKLLLVTKHVGFPRNFYDEAPLGQEECISENFAKTAKRLHRDKDVFALLDKSSLPQVKSVRRMIYLNPALCFYIKELEMFWEILRDPNLFVYLFEKIKLRYTVLALVHEYPCTRDFFSDYVRERGAKALLFRIEKRWGRLQHYAIYYSTMSPIHKKNEQKRWEEDVMETGVYLPFSRPIMVSQEIPNSVVDGFSFIALRTTSECRKAGELLKNCLGGRDEYSESFLFVVKYDGEYKAAIEIKGDSIIQARAKHNWAIEEVPDLQKAYEKWRAKFNLKDRRHCAQYDDDIFELEEDMIPF